MFAALFILSQKGTEQPAASPTVVTDRAAYIGHCNSIRENKKNENEREHGCPAMGVPDIQAFFLDRRDV